MPKETARKADRVMVILDSDHDYEHVSQEMRAYADLVTAGSYLIVEDGNINGNPVLPDFGPGPAEAIAQFLSERADFTVDESREKFYLTFNPRGYLRKLAARDHQDPDDRVADAIDANFGAEPDVSEAMDVNHPGASNMSDRKIKSE